MTPVNHTDLHRAARDISRDAAAHTSAMGTTVRAMLESDASADQRHAALLGRRRFLELGGFSVATAAVLAACSSNDHPLSVGKVGVAPTTTKLPDPIVNDVVLLRTAASLEYSAISVYDTVIGNADLLDPKFDEVAKRFRDDHAGHAALFDKLTTEAGGTAWGCSNPRIDALLITPVMRAITGGDATALLAAVEPSEDPRRDVLNFAHGLETLAGATYQGLVPALSQPSLRKESLLIASHEVRHAALLALAITDVPDGIIPPTEAPAEPPVIPVVYAVPSRFGGLGTTQVVVGIADEHGARTTFALDTPSLNTFVYEYMTPAC